MSGRIGLELGATTVRAVRIDHRPRMRVRTAEAAFEGNDAASAIAIVREQLGAASSVAIAGGVAHLFAKEIALPPVAAGEKRRMLTLEPERFFPVRGTELAIATRGGGDGLVFAARDGVLAPWLAAAGELGALELVEAAPISLGRALARVGVREGTVLLEGDGDRVALVDLAAGRVAHARRIARDVLAAEGAQTVSLPHDLPVPATHLAAFGAALGSGAPTEEMLGSPELLRRIDRRRLRRLAVAALVFVGALALAATSLESARGRSAAALAREVAELRQPAERVLAMQAQLRALDEEAQAVAAVEAKRMDPVAVLRALGARLPKEAYVRSLRGAGNEWQVGGYATDASRVVPALEDAPEFEGVRTLGATSRTTTGGRTYENFSVTLRLSAAR